MADDRRQQLADEAGRHSLSIGVDERRLLCTCGWSDKHDDNLTNPNGRYGLHVADRLLPLLDRVAADAAAEALERAVAKQDTWREFWDEPRSDYGQGRHDAHEITARDLRARAAELRAPARTDEEN